MPGRKIFLSYRRDDTSGHVGRLRDRLTQRYGESAVFWDIEGVEPTRRYRDEIERALDECRIVCVVIGKQWVSISQTDGIARLRQHDDVVRWEIARSIQKGLTILPVLVGGGTMPDKSDLPPDIRKLAGVMAHTMSEANWEADFQALVRLINRVFTTDEQTSEWDIKPRDRTVGLVELRLHPPRMANAPNTFYLDATLRFGMGRYEYNGRTVLIGLRAALLKWDSTSHQPARGSLIGERVQQEHVRPGVECLEFTPRASNDYLTGDQFGEDYVALMEPTSAAELNVTIIICAERESFNVTEAGGRDLTPKKEAILKALIYEGRQTDGQGHVIVARTQLKKRPRK
jgi:hypothetical protein